MLIDKEALIRDMCNSVWDPKELRSALMCIDEQPAEDDVDTFIGKFNQCIVELCDPMNRNDDVIEIRGRLFIRLVTIGKILDQCVKGW